MRVVLIFVSLFTLLISLATCEYSDCDAENPSPGLILHRLELPETLHIGRLNKINVNASLLEDLEPDDLIAMNIHKKIWFQKVWAPCILGQGSCTKTFQQWFNGSKKFVCEFLEELGQPCEARIRQNTYARNIDVEIDPILIPRVFRKVVPVSSQ